jgi:kinetochore protein NDC80
MNTIKDPRPIANRAFRMQCQQNVIDYLAIHRCPLPRNIDNVTAKEFQTIFRFLVSGPVGLDPGYNWREKKFEDDVIAILKDLRYPAMENVGKMALGMPGGQNVWPHHVAMLNWLVEMCKVGPLLTSLTLGA